MQDDRPVAVVTGASAGIGRAVALAFAREGACVALIARGRDRLESAAREVEEAGGRALVLIADVADGEAVDKAAEEVMRAFGRIDIWVNNAMATIYSPVARIRAEEVRRVTEVTYLGQVHGTLAALRHMRPRKSGTIVQIGSALAYRSIPLQSAYCAAKAAVRGFTDALRSELIHERSGIRVTMVQLPAVDTPQFDWARSRMSRRLQPVPPIHAPEPVAEAILRASFEAPRELWVGGANRPGDPGHLPHARNHGPDDGAAGLARADDRRSGAAARRQPVRGSARRPWRAGSLRRPIPKAGDGLFGGDRSRARGLCHSGSRCRRRGRLVPISDHGVQAQGRAQLEDRERAARFVA
jgi:NAD(P)-dependent dehydrogenase (short-subunit alcohol dehydrogenase family)